MQFQAVLDALAKSAVACDKCFDGRGLVRSFVDTAQPRYVGKGYWTSSSRVAFVMLNPAAGKADWRNEDWRTALRNYKNRACSLQSVFDAQRRHMPFWSSGKLIKFLRLHGLDVDSTALVNIAWCATDGNEYPPWMLSECLNTHTNTWLKKLAPNVVLLSGSAAHPFKDKLAELLPDVTIHKTFHYAHRPLDAAKAEKRASEIQQLLNS